MMRLGEYRDQLCQGGIIVGLIVVLCVVLIFHFTDRRPDGAQRERAHIMLQRIVALQQAYHAENGTYLAIDRENNGDVLQLNGSPGRFRYWVTVSGDEFVAYAEADFDYDGQPEIWTVDAKNTEPVLQNRD